MNTLQGFGFRAVLTVAAHGCAQHGEYGAAYYEEGEETKVVFQPLVTASWPEAFKTYLHKQIEEDEQTHYFIVQRTSDALHVIKHDRSAAAEFTV